MQFVWNGSQVNAAAHFCWKVIIALGNDFVPSSNMLLIEPMVSYVVI